MNIFAKLFGSSIEKPIEAVGNSIDKIFTSDEERMQAEAVLEKLRQAPDILQIELNKLNAASIRLFDSGWRPFIGWICGISLACYFIPQAILTSILWVMMCLKTGNLLPYPNVSGQLYELVMGMLGMSILRTVEKFKGKA